MANDDADLQNLLRQKKHTTRSTKLTNVITKKVQKVEEVQQEVLDLDEDVVNPPLPKFHEEYGHLPAIIALAELFHSYRISKSTIIENRIIGKYMGHDLTYVFGQRLTYQDEELLMALFLAYSANGAEFSKTRHVKIRISELCSYLGLSKGGKNNTRIYKRLEVFMSTVFALSSPDYDPEANTGTRTSFSILTYLHNHKGEIEFALDPIWSRIFSEYPVTRINMAIRLRLSPHARVIYRLLCTSSNFHQRLSEKRLRAAIGWDGKRIYDFYEALKKASDELKAHNLIYKYGIIKSPSKELIFAFDTNQRALKPV